MQIKDGVACSDCMRKLGKDFSVYLETFTKEQVKKGISGEMELIAPVKCQCTNGVLVIDSTNRILYESLALFQKTNDIPLDTIVGYTYNEDDKQYGVGRTLGGAVIGGLLFSGVGAVIGSVIGANPKRRIKKISIDIIYETSGQCQIFTACLYNGKPLKPSGWEYNSYVEKAKIVMGQLDMLLEKKKNTQAEMVKMVSSVSLADEIRKFKALFDDGIITEEEFTKKKNQLLKMDGSVDEVSSKDDKSEEKDMQERKEKAASENNHNHELREYLIVRYYPKNKTGVIQHYREQTGAGLIEAKKYVDKIFAEVQ